MLINIHYCKACNFSCKFKWIITFPAHWPAVCTWTGWLCSTGGSLHCKLVTFTCPLIANCNGSASSATLQSIDNMSTGQLLLWGADYFLLALIWHRTIHIKCFATVTERRIHILWSFSLNFIITLLFSHGDSFHIFMYYSIYSFLLAYLLLT